MHSSAEENYLKAIYKLQEAHGETATAPALAQVPGIHMAPVIDMLKKMSNRKPAAYQKSKRFKLTEKSRMAAIGIIRKHVERQKPVIVSFKVANSLLISE